MAEVSLRQPEDGQIEIDINQLEHVVVPQEELDPFLLKKTKVPVSTVPELNVQQTITAIQKAGFQVNEVDRDLKYLVTFEMPRGEEDISDWPEPLKSMLRVPAGGAKRVRDKSGWPNSPYIRSDGPSVQLEQFGMRQPRQCCGGYKPPTSDGLRLHFRPAEFGHGSELDVMYEHDANASPVCCKSKKENEWLFKSPGREDLTFKMLPEVETGPIWQLFQGESELASVDVPKAEEKEWYIYCPCKPAFPFCCGTEIRGITPMVWLRVKAKSDRLGQMVSVYTIRNQEEDTDMKCCCGMCRVKMCWCLPQGFCDGCDPIKCSATCSAWCYTCCTCQCRYGCKRCRCGTCYLPPQGCCDPAEDVPLYATGRGKVNQLKKPGQRIMIREGQVVETHDVHLKYADTPARPPMPSMDMEMRFRYPAKSSQPPIPGREFHFSSRNEPIMQDEEQKRKDRWVMGKHAVKPGQNVREGDLLGYAKKVKNCCGISCCPSITGCPNYCACMDICRVVCPPIACAIGICLNPGQLPFCCCCPYQEPEFEYQQSPVTGEWANSEETPKDYRVRAEVNAVKAIGEAGYMMANVEAGLESGTSEIDHIAFALVNMMEMVEDLRRPAFHVEIDPPPKPSKGLPPRQQLMLAPPEEGPAEGGEEE
jgi:hypothetical protein